MPKTLMPKTLEHITLTSGGVRESPRSEVDDDIVDLVRAAIRGDGLLGDWRVRLTSQTPSVYAFDLEHAGLRVAMAWLCRDAGATRRLWPTLAAFAPTGVRLFRPRSVPWLAASLDLANVEQIVKTPEILMQAADLERVVAWALLETN